MGDRRAAKKQVTRQRISDVATALFLAHGFDAVTFDDVAAAAKVSRMTVFNYFPHKEDLILDRQDDLRMTLLRDAIRTRRTGQSAVDALRALVTELRAQGHPLTRVDRDTVDWWRFIETRPSLRARLREFYDEATEGLALELGGPTPDTRAWLTAGIVVLTVRTARQESVRAFDRGAGEEGATAAFFAAFEQGFDAAERLTAGAAAMELPAGPGRVFGSSRT
ncbi:TetR/AcrR family transcriptional regulator [Mycobacteroides abscessus]|uniref:TetR/AcrR family transcriptional regulator n=1 Tax=Mycobacteroides abscessus TaxID=36809 RepID=UPI000D3E5CBC|nr:TetR family transcriptional regulator [Mycobacteroides abscessus]PVB36266.1 BetI family transcriptional regulator [Mycobacteroides abscessus]